MFIFNALWKRHKYALMFRNGEPLTLTWSQILRALFDATNFDFDAMSGDQCFAWSGTFTNRPALANLDKYVLKFISYYSQTNHVFRLLSDTIKPLNTFTHSLSLVPTRSSAAIHRIAATPPAARALLTSTSKHTMTIVSEAVAKQAAATIQCFASLLLYQGWLAAVIQVRNLLITFIAGRRRRR